MLQFKESISIYRLLGAAILTISMAAIASAQGLVNYETVKAFKKDAAPYIEAISWISTMYDDMDKDYAPVMDAGTIKKSLADVSGFAAIIKQKYASVEDPPWAHNWEDKIGSWRKLVEGREEIAKKYIANRLVAVLKKKAEQMDKDRMNLASSLGFALPVGFDDRELLHSTVSKEFTPIFAAAGLSMPDASIFAAFDKSVDALVSEARKHAADWKWDATARNATAEAKARQWMKTFDPKAEIIKIGMTDAAWKVNRNSLGIPTGRYMRGMILYRKPGLGECVAAKFSFEQSYTGGGAYNAMASTSGFTYLVRMQSCK